jgi:hypothetical protein
MLSDGFPTSQGELIRRARGNQTQTAFAKVLQVDRTCLSRYESEQLGAPTAVINYCLRAIAAQAVKGPEGATPLLKALRLTRDAVRELEVATAERKQGG